ncbi:phosphatidylinositol-specific phospholipase C [Enterobacter cancerogenus]
MSNIDSFIQSRAGTYTDPKVWDDAGVKGDIYYSTDLSSFFMLQKDGTPVEHNWYYPTDGNDNAHWIVKGNVTKQEWLKYIEDERPINQISIPGSHDSATYTINPMAFVSGYVKTQDDSITKQLESGIRFIDARCRHIEDIFAMHHGEIYLNINFGSIVQECQVFLEKHPDEFIIMSVKKEHTDENNTRTFSETFVDRYYRPENWFGENRIPKLKEVRGKIVLLRRFSGSTLGIDLSNWPDNQTFDSGKIHVQDQYNQHDEVLKWHAIRDAWNFATSYSNQGWLTLNFTSISADTFTPIRSYAQDKNPELASFINGTKNTGGWVISDFPDIGDIAEKVILTNFGQITNI